VQKVEAKIEKYFVFYSRLEHTKNYVIVLAESKHYKTNLENKITFLD